MTGPVDLIELIRSLPARPRGRACIVLTHDYSGQQAWAAELARRTEAAHLDLLERFYRDDELANAVSLFMVPRLFDWLRSESDERISIVSGLEFLKASWSGQPNRLEEFATRVETWHRTPCLVFILQYDKTLANREFRRHRQYPFVVDQRETLALA